MKFAFYSFGLWIIGIGTGASIIQLERFPLLLWLCLLGWALLVLSFASFYLGTEN